MADLKFLDEYTNGLNFVINLKHRNDRMEAFAEHFNALGIPYHRIDAIYGIENAEVQNRLAHIKGWTPNGNSILSSADKDKSGKSGISRSQLEAIKEAIKQKNMLREAGKPVPRFAAFFEDDSTFLGTDNFSQEKICNHLKAALQHIPDDASMVYLGLTNRASDGYFPISADAPNNDIVKVSSAYGTHNYLVSTDFLEVLEQVLEANLQSKGNLSTGIGGEEPIDVLYAMLHAYLALGERPSKASGNHHLISAFENALQTSNFKHRPAVYCVNPAVGGDYSGDKEGRGKSDILTDFEPDYRLALKVGKKLAAVTHSQARSIRTAYKIISNSGFDDNPEKAIILKREIRNSLDQFLTGENSTLKTADQVKEYLWSYVPNMTILHVLPSLDPGGLSESVLTLLHHSKNADPKAKHVLVTYKNHRHVTTHQMELLEKQGIELIEINPTELGFPDLDDGTGHIKNSQDTHSVRKLVQAAIADYDIKADVVQSWMEMSDVLGDEFGKSLKAARVSVVNNGRHPSSFSNDEYRQIITKSAERALEKDVIITVSDYMRHFLTAKWPEEGLGFPVNANIDVIYEGVDIDKFKPDSAARVAIRKELSIPPAAPVIGMLSRLKCMKDCKGFLMIAAALKRLDPSIHFILSGDGFASENDSFDDDLLPNHPIAMYLDQIRDYMGVDLRDGTLHLLGHRRDPEKIMNTLDTLVSTSQAEAFGRTLIEAKAIGIPSAVTDVGPMPAISGKNGAVFPKRNIENDGKLLHLDKNWDGEKINSIWREDEEWAGQAAIQIQALLHRTPEEKSRSFEEEVTQAQGHYTMDGVAAQYLFSAREALNLYKERYRKKPDSVIEASWKGIKRIAALLFDWDDTLTNTDAFGHKFYTRIHEELKAEGYSPIVDNYLDNPTGLSPADRMREMYGTKVPEHTVNDVMERIYKELESTDPVFMKGAKELLIHFRDKHIPLAIVSNQPDEILKKNVWKILSQKEFPDLKIIGVSDTLPPKPAPDTILEALKLLGVEPTKDAYYIGDNAEKDMIAANRAGVSGILIGKDSDKAPADANYTTVRDFIELQQVLDDKEKSPRISIIG